MTGKIIAQLPSTAKVVYTPKKIKFADGIKLSSQLPFKEIILEYLSVSNVITGALKMEEMADEEVRAMSYEKDSTLHNWV